MTSGKYFILNADDFGMSPGANEAVLEDFKTGLLKSASICTNGGEFDAAVREVVPACPGLGLGVHLNIIEGKSLSGVSPLTDGRGFFNKGFGYLLLHAGNAAFLSAVEKEFRAQVEKGSRTFPVDHLDSHVHTHAIPGIFKIAASLAEEYRIPWLRTQRETMYLAGADRIFTVKYPVNIIKVLLLNHFTGINKKTLEEHKLRTNDHILGVGYTGMMNEGAIERGLRAIKGPGVTEALIHPNTEKNPAEYAIAKSIRLKEKILGMGYSITNYSEIS